jgi:hypothetical protein
VASGWTNILLKSIITDETQGVDKIRETLRNRGIEFVSATLKELQFATLNVVFCLFTLYTVSTLVVVLSDSPCERIGKWETCLILKEDRSLVCF